jgi:hypothetical protein
MEIEALCTVSVSQLRRQDLVAQVPLWAVSAASNSLSQQGQTYFSLTGEK